MSESEIANIIEGVAKLPERLQTDTIVSRVAPFIKDEMSASEIKDIIYNIAKLSESVKPEVFLVAAPFLKEDMKAADIVCIVSTISDIILEKNPSDNVFSLGVSFTKAAAPFLKEDMKAADIANIITSLAKIPIKDVVNVCNAAALLIKEGMSTSDIAEIIKEVASNPKANDKVCLAAAPFIKEGQIAAMMRFIINAIAEISEEKQEAVCSAVKLLSVSDMPAFQVAAIIKAIGRIQGGDEDRKRVCDTANNCIRAGSTDFDLVDKINAMVETSNIQHANYLYNQRSNR